MISTRFARVVALPVLSAGIIGGAALGLAGMANADTGTDIPAGGSYSFNASPTVYANPAPNLVPWGQWINEGSNSVGSNQYNALIGTAANP